MINVEQAYKLAEAFVSLQREISSGIRHGMGDLIEYHDFFYFDFTIVYDAEMPTSDAEFGGAPGFTIDKITGEAKIISWHELGRLKENKRKI